MTVDVKLFTSANNHPRPFFSLPDEPWMMDALCTEIGGDIFYSPPDDGGLSVRQAKRVCRLCKVQEDCLRYALEHEEVHGVWGGKSPRERHRILNGLSKLGHRQDCKCSMCVRDAA